MSSSASALKLLDLIHSHRVTAVIYVAARLGIADCCPAGQSRWTRLSGQLALTGPLGALARGAVDNGHLHAGVQEGYALGETGAALVGTASPSCKAWAIFEGRNAIEVVERDAGNDHDRQYGRTTPRRQQQL